MTTFTVEEYKIFLVRQGMFTAVCRNGNIETAKKLFSKNPNITITQDIFSEACYNGYLELAKWMVTLEPKVTKYYVSAFICACRQGHLEIAQWIFSLDDSVIEDKLSFILACFYGKLEVAQWLLSISPNIDNKTDETNELYDNMFQVACGNDKIPVAQWIMSLKPYRYYLEIQDEEQEIVNYYVRDSRDINWLQRRIPLLAYNNNNPESQNIFKVLNLDLIREICMFV